MCMPRLMFDLAVSKTRSMMMMARFLTCDEHTALDANKKNMRLVLSQSCCFLHAVQWSIRY